MAGTTNYTFTYTSGATTGSFDVRLQKEDERPGKPAPPRGVHADTGGLGATGVDALGRYVAALNDLAVAEYELAHAVWRYGGEENIGKSDLRWYRDRIKEATERAAYHKERVEQTVVTWEARMTGG